MFKQLSKINKKPQAFEYYTAQELWADPYISEQMLQYHLHPDLDIASRKATFIEESVHWIAEQFNINRDTEICDFGCGPGLYTNKLAELGAQVTGIDFSENSIRYAKKVADKKHLHINYIHQNYLDYDGDKEFDLIMMIMCDFCALSPDQRSILLYQFHHLLKNSGSLILDVYSLNAYNAREETAIYERNQMNQFWSPKEYYAFVNTFKYDNEKVILDQYTIIEEDRSRVIYNWLQYFSKFSLEEELLKHGFSIQNFYSDVTGNPFCDKSNEFAIHAVKAHH